MIVEFCILISNNEMTRKKIVSHHRVDYYFDRLFYIRHNVYYKDTLKGILRNEEFYSFVVAKSDLLLYGLCKVLLSGRQELRAMQEGSYGLLDRT